MTFFEDEPLQNPLRANSIRGKKYPVGWIGSIFCGLLCSGCAISLLGGPKFDPSLTWRVIKTPHFRVYFHEGEDKWAQKAARIAEETHSILVKRLVWEPAEPTHLVLIDHQDATFGSALPFPHNSIYIDLTPPPGNPLPFLVRSEDWLRQVITHEYVHVLQLDMNTEFTSIMRTLFGRQPLPFLIFNGALPNIWQPAWLIEGLATYEETALGVSDRRDSAYAEMVLRMAILENQFPTLDQAGGRDTWPGGQTPYIFGAGFYDYIARRFGERSLKDLSLAYSSNTFPFFVGTTAKQLLGQSYNSLWQNWEVDLEKKYGQQRKQLEGLGLTLSRPITHHGDYNLGPKVNPNGRQIVYTSVNPHEYPALRVVDTESGQDRLLIRRNMGFTASWSPDGQQLAFSQLEVYKNYSVYSDLYLYDLSKKTLKRVTHGARLRDPDFHPDGTRLICVENRSGENRLVIYDLNAGQQEVLDWIEKDAILTHPRWSPDGRYLAVTSWVNGLQGIYLVDMEQKKAIPILMDRALDLTPTWSPDGKFIVFSSERTGIYNLFAYAMETDELFQITNVLRGAFTPEVTPDSAEIIFSSYSNQGFDLHRMPWSPTTWRKIEMMVEGQTQEPANKEIDSGISPGSYSPWPTLRTRFWTPIVGYDEDGWQVGAATGGRDVLGRHKFDAAVLYGAETHRVAYSLQYVNDSFYPTIHVGVTDLAIQHPDLLEDDDYWERRQRLVFDIALPRIALQRVHSLTFRYQVERLSALTEITAGAIPPEEGYLSGPGISWRFDSTKEYGFSVSSEDGRQLMVSYQRFDHYLGSDFDQSRYIASWREYRGLFWRHHVLAARLTGGLATGDRLIQRAFEVGGPTLTEELLNPEQAEFFLRGYPSRILRGQRAAVGTLEYRFPIWNIERGVRTWPFFFQRMHAALFYDIGNAWDGGTQLSEFRDGVGAEVKMDMILGHLLPLRLRLGLAQGLDEEGKTQVYLTIGNSF